MIDLSINQALLERALERARQNNIIIPTFEQQIHPETIPADIKSQLREVSLWDVNPLNLFRINWQNEAQDKGGLYADYNFIELPSELTGVPARILALVGKWFPTGAHKVGAAFGCLVPRLVTGQFDPTTTKAVWPSTGNYCRGGAYNSALLGCDSVAILPEEMSKERFDWLKSIAGEVIATPGGESNVKEIYDKCHELRRTREDIMIFNQFEEFGNYLWHYAVTGQAMHAVLNNVMAGNDRFTGTILSTGSAGTMGCADYLKQVHPNSLAAATEALQCPTLLLNGYGDHRIEGIGDKHVPWIHNVRNTDLVIAVDDQACLNLLRLFNEPAGHEVLRSSGVTETQIDKLPLLGISSISNLLAAIKFAKYFELTKNDFIFTVFTDSTTLYKSRLSELHNEFGDYKPETAAGHQQRYLNGIATDNMLELTYPERKRIHNLKYFTWIEQQGKSVAELDAQWYDHDYWINIQRQVGKIDKLIKEFNTRTGL